MFHKNAAKTVRSLFPIVSGTSAEDTSDITAAIPAQQEVSTPRLTLVNASRRGRNSRGGASAKTFAQASCALPELLSIAARRCSSFFAEAAVLVLVFGILDFFMLKGKIELAWVGGAFAISIVLLGASIGTDFSARRWLGAQP